MSKKKKKSHVVRNLLVLAVLAGAGGAACVNFGDCFLKTSEETEAGSYREEKVQYGSVAAGITESGSVTFGSADQEFSVAEAVEVSDSSQSSSDQSSLGSSASGGTSQAAFSMNGGMDSSSGSSGSSSSGTSTALEVEEVYVASGQVVETGDPLLKITEESIEEYRSSLESALASARLKVQKEEINVESKRSEADYTYNMYIAEGKTAEATYQATITSLENAVADLEEELQESAELIAEYEEDLENGEDAEDELEEEELNYSTIEANLQIAKNNLTTQSIEAKQTYENAMTNYQYADQLYAIDTDGLEDDLNDAKDTAQEAENALNEFEEQIGDGIIYAEYAGTVMSVAYSKGDEITNDAVVATFADADNVTMTVSVSQEDISEISIGNEAAISLTAYEGESFSGEVLSIATSSTPGSSTVNYEVEVRFTGDISKVYSGMTGEVTFVEKEASDVLYISNKAVHQDGARSWVKVLQEDGSIEEVTIKTGFSNGSKVEVTSGLSEGQTILIESQVNG